MLCKIVMQDWQQMHVLQLIQGLECTVILFAIDLKVDLVCHFEYVQTRLGGRYRNLNIFQGFSVFQQLRFLSRAEKLRIKIP